MYQLIFKLRSLLTKRDKQFLFVLFVFSIIISVIETAGVSVVMPFIAVATDFSLIETNQYYSYIYSMFSFENYSSFVLVFEWGLSFFILLEVL